ncbi:hypothetical protein SprV_0200678600 [Sparganum proliferum]
MREKYPPKSSSSTRGSSTGSESRGTPTSSPVDIATSMADQWQSPYEERPDSLPDEVEVTSRDVLRSWAVSTKIPLQHLTTLLKVMRRMTPEELYSLPLDARTLLGGAGNLPPIRALGGGEYVHLGLVKQLTEQLRAFSMKMVSELRQQQAAMMNHGQQGMSSSPSGSARFNLSPVGTQEQLDALTSALSEENYRHQLCAETFRIRRSPIAPLFLPLGLNSVHMAVNEVLFTVCGVPNYLNIRQKNVATRNEQIPSSLLSLMDESSSSSSSNEILIPSDVQLARTSEGRSVRQRLAVGAGIGFAAASMVYLLSPFLTPAFRRICLPFVPATPSQLRNVCRLLRHAQCSGQRLGRVLDIGSGDGRVVTSVLTDPHLCVDQAVGVELNRPLVWLSRWRAWRLGLLPSRASFYRADLWKFSLSPYQTVVVFGVDSMMEPLEAKMLQELRGSPTVVACRFPLPNLTCVMSTGEGPDAAYLYFPKPDK